jgi:hypothetical protein
MMSPKQSSSAKQIQRDLSEKLGEGPMRFGPVHIEVPVRQQLLNCQDFDACVNAFGNLYGHWEMSGESRKKKFTETQMLRILRFTHFDDMRALSLMKRMDPRHFQLNSVDLEDQLRSKALFPVPGLRTLEGSNCFYMRPCRYDPHVTPTNAIIDNLIYVLDNYSARDPELKCGIAFIANMSDWKLEHFSTEYCRKFMQVLQGRAFPARVNLFLIVNPPKWFGKVWAIMRGMLAKKFIRKIHMIAEDEIGFFFKHGYETYLPDEFLEGKASTDKMVDDFITYQREMEIATGKVMKRSLFGLLSSGPSTEPKLFKGKTSGNRTLRKLFCLTNSTKNTKKKTTGEENASAKIYIDEALEILGGADSSSTANSSYLMSDMLGNGSHHIRITQ